MEDKRLKATARLLEVMNTLRRECPWDREQTFDSLRSNTIEETYELADAITAHNMEGIKEELGDLLFAAVKVARFAGIDPEQAAHAACEKFIRRFSAMETAAANDGTALEQCTLAQMLTLWQQAKQTVSAEQESRKSARQ